MVTHIKLGHPTLSVSQVLDPYTALADNLWPPYANISDNLWTPYANISDNLWSLVTLH